MDQQSEEWIKELLTPLRAERSEVFVQKVMRKVRAYQPQEEWVPWPVFARWALPALALSVTSFMVTMVYSVSPSLVPTDTLLLSDSNQGLSAQWFSNPPNEDQILDDAVVKP